MACPGGSRTQNFSEGKDSDYGKHIKICRRIEQQADNGSGLCPRYTIVLFDSPIFFGDLMEEPRDSFVFYRSFRSALDYLNDTDHRELINMILDRALDRKEVSSDNHLINTFFAMIEPNIDANYRKAVSGVKGGRPKKPMVTVEETIGLNKKNLSLENKKANVDVDVDVDVDDILTKEEVISCCSPGRGRRVFVEEDGKQIDADTGELITPFDEGYIL